MKHLGDITKIKGAEIEPVDVIVGGSPCQDLSVAGNRAGLDGERSGLFMEQIRIVKEMRDATTSRSTGHVRPRYMVWENVPGAFSSNKAEDFRIVLEETARVADSNAVIPRPPKNKWTTAGCVMGDGWSIAWRVQDAQFWGVPQRRRRIALVADFGGHTAPEILFERKGVFGDITESGTEGKGAAGDVAGGVGAAECYGIDAAIMTGGNCTAQGPCYYRDIQATLKASAPHGVAYSIGGFNFEGMLSPNPHAGIYEANTSRTLDLNGGNPACNQGGIAVVHPRVAGTMCASGAGTDRPAGQCNETDMLVVSVGCMNHKENFEVSGAICSKNKPGYSLNRLNPVRTGYTVRRLTPLECERLQGYPDGWTDIMFRNKPASDSVRYKALGNSIALPPWRFVLGRIYDHGARTMGSLFDGIGGFPFIWMELGGKTPWASEIEPFCIAVTIMRFRTDGVVE